MLNFIYLSMVWFGLHTQNKRYKNVRRVSKTLGLMIISIELNYSILTAFIIYSYYNAFYCLENRKNIIAKLCIDKRKKYK